MLEDRTGTAKAMTPKTIKGLAKSMGADLCGIAPAERFAGAPAGFKPTDIYPGCKSVVVYAKRLPPQILAPAGRVPYTLAMDTAFRELDRIGTELCVRLADRGIGAVPIPSADPYEHWEPGRSHGRGILSLRHAGHLAGLGVMGANTLLVNEKYGNLICPGAILVDVELRPDKVITEHYCPPGCRLCLDACPKKALDGITVDQKSCREAYRITTEKGYSLINCNICRKVCPNRAGVVKRTGSRADP